MADRLAYYFRERVTEAELNLGFELLEEADRNLAADIGVYGVVAGAVPTQHAPIADLTIDLTAPARAYDRLGQRIFFGTGQTVNLAVDSTGIPTDVSTVGQERWVGVFLRFHRLLSDPRTDGNSQQVFFRHDESFEIVVRQGPQASVGSAPKVALVDDELLLCDVRRSAGQTQILNADIDASRRQAFVFAQGASVGVTAGLWKVISKATLSVQAALDAVDALLAGHFGATGLRHGAQDVDYAPHGFIASKTVKAALDELVDDLASGDPAGSGASRVNVDAIAGVPNALSAGSVRSQLAQLLGWLNAHLGAAAGAHAASAIAATPFGFLASKSVQAMFQELVGALQTAAANQGAALIANVPLGGLPRAVAAGSVADQLAGLLGQLNAHAGSGDHDARYLRRVLSAHAVVPAGGSKALGVLAQAPDFTTIAYNLVDPSEQPLSPQFLAGPLTPSLALGLEKLGSARGTVTLTNGSAQKLFVSVNAYQVG